MRKITNHHIEGGTRESHPRVQDLLQHPRLTKPRRGLQILDTRMGFPCPFLNVVLDSIILVLVKWLVHKRGSVTFLIGLTRNPHKFICITLVFKNESIHTEVNNRVFILRTVDLSLTLQTYANCSNAHLK